MEKRQNEGFQKQRPEPFTKEVRIKRLPPWLHQELRCIADFTGVSIADIVRPYLSKIANDYPAHVRSFRKIEP